MVTLMDKPEWKFMQTTLCTSLLYGYALNNVGFEGLQILVQSSGLVV
jgi:hypothetical protein